VIDRRTFLAGAIAVLLTAPVASPVSAQPLRRIVRVGILNAGTAHDWRVDGFLDGLRELGYVEGQNLHITHRWAEGRQDRLPELAAELVADNVDVIVAIGPAVWAAKRQTSTIPIVIAFSGDPVRTGMVSSLARPGANLTGVSFMSSDLASKRLELLKQTSSRIGRVAALYDPAELASIPELQETEAAARAIGVTVQPLEGREPSDLDRLFAAAARQRADALLVFAHGFALLNRGRIIELAARQRLPTMYGYREFVDAGGLMAYGPNVPAMVRRAASYVDRIVKGAKPGDLPIEQPTTFELVINLKTAKALGVTIPQSILVRADEVIR
jgi:putative tryptophan/tyrosine transport system substrate-binding protein